MPVLSTDALTAMISTAPNRFPWYKASISAQAAGSFIDLLTAGGFPPAGVAPATGNGTTYDRTTQGAFPITNAGSGKTLTIGLMTGYGTAAGTLVLYDRLWAVSGYSGTVTTPQGPGTPPTLPRYTTGDLVECWMEVYTALGATSTTATLSYTNQAGTSGRSGTLTVPASMGANRMLPFNLQAGDSGVRTIANVTLAASTGTAGNFGLTLLRRIAEIPIIVAHTGPQIDPFFCGLADLPNDSSLYFMVLVSGTSTPVLTGRLVIGETNV